MKLIKPSQISGEIMTLIEEADKELIIVSPYCKFSDWKKFLNKIEFLKRKNIPVEFYVREGINDTIDEVGRIGFTPILIPNLHTKLYINESYAIVSSMNLLTYSDANSLDIAYKTESLTEYNELIDYYNRYLAVHKPEPSIKQSENNSSLQVFDHSSNIYHGMWKEYTSELLSNYLNCRCRASIEDFQLIIQCNNKYFVRICNESASRLLITGILSHKEYEVLISEKSKFEKESSLSINVNEGEEGYYSTVSHESGINLNSKVIGYLEPQDYNIVIQTIINFIITLENFKGYCRELRNQEYNNSL